MSIYEVGSATEMLPDRPMHGTLQTEPQGSLRVKTDMNSFTKTTIVCVFIAMCATWGCASSPANIKPDGSKQDTTEMVVMEPLHIGLKPDPELGLTDFDASALFHEGLRLHEAEKFSDALKFYDRILSDFPKSRYVSAAAFNAGRCLELLHRDREAIERYRMVTENMPRSKDWVDAMFRLAGVYQELDENSRAISVLNRLLSRQSLTASDRMDAMVLLGESLMNHGDLLLAERKFHDALRFFRKHEKEEYLDPSPAARSEFRLAELATGRFQAAPLRLPEERMKKDLENKARLLLLAQAGYLRTMRWGDADWATAAGYRIGKLYLDLHEAMEKSPAPEDLSDEEVAVYRDLLKERLAVLLRKALKVFEMTLELAERTRSDNSWTRAARQEMERVENLVLGRQEKTKDKSTTSQEHQQAPGQS